MPLRRVALVLQFGVVRESPEGEVFLDSPKREAFLDGTLRVFPLMAFFNILVGVQVGKILGSSEGYHHSLPSTSNLGYWVKLKKSFRVAM